MSDNQSLDFTQELTKLINKFSLENISDTPDFILANYIGGCLNNYAEAVEARDTWQYGIQMEAHKVNG